MDKIIRKKYIFWWSLYLWYLFFNRHKDYNIFEVCDQVLVRGHDLRMKITENSQKSFFM